MQPYNWDELEKLWESWVKNDEGGMVSIGTEEDNLRGWLVGFPKEARPAAALAMSLTKWRVLASGRHRDMGPAPWTCGCCQLFECRDCPLSPSCIPGDPDETADFILEKYQEAFDRLPAEWREQ